MTSPDFSFDPSACGRCAGNCCRGASGAVYIDHAEIERIASYLRLSTVDLITDCLVRCENRWTIREKVTDSESRCLFFSLESKRCRIYAVRPAQCRSFPFWDYFRQHPEELAAECPGIRMSR